MIVESNLWTCFEDLMGKWGKRIKGVMLRNKMLILRDRKHHPGVGALLRTYMELCTRPGDSQGCPDPKTALAAFSGLNP